MKNVAVKKALLALERFCSYRERTYMEVEQKLQDLDIDADLFPEVIRSLRENNFLNEERYAKSFARGKFLINKWGRVKIKQALQKKAVSEASIKIGLLEIDDREYRNTIQNLLDKKYPKVKAKNEYERKQKLSLYLRQKGYEMTLIFEFVWDV